MSDQAEQTMPVVVVLPAEIDVTNSELVHERIVAALTPGVDVVIADMTRRPSATRPGCTR